MHDEDRGSARVPQKHRAVGVKRPADLSAIEYEVWQALGDAAVRTNAVRTLLAAMLQLSKTSRNQAKHHMDLVIRSKLASLLTCEQEHASETGSAI